MLLPAARAVGAARAPSDRPRTSILTPRFVNVRSGVIRSEVFPGLRLAVDALLVGDVARVLAVLQEGIGTAEHAEFVKRLRTGS